jgi:hypothetical protein
MAAIAGHSDGTIEHLLEWSPSKAEDGFYLDTMEKLDSGIRRSYEDQWRYHDQQTLFQSASANPFFWQMGGGTGAKEMDVRHQFAQAVLRQRANAFFHETVIPLAAPLSLSSKRLTDVKTRLKKTQAEIAKMKHTEVALSADPMSLRLQLGYDVITDASKLELVSQRWGAGIYHSKLVGGITGASVPASALSFRFTTTSLSFATTTIAIYPQSQAIEGELSRRVSARAEARVGTYQTSNAADYSRYRVSFGYAF